MTTETQKSTSFGPYIFAAGILVAIAGSAKLPETQGGFPRHASHLYPGSNRSSHWYYSLASTN